MIYIQIGLKYSCFEAKHYLSQLGWELLNHQNKKGDTYLNLGMKFCPFWPVT